MRADTDSTCDENRYRTSSRVDPVKGRWASLWKAGDKGATVAMTSTYLVQTFTNKRKPLVPRVREISPSESGVLKKAQAMAGRMPGTAALEVVADDETGEWESATILGQFGEIPEDFSESLQGG
jgi:hypothetical protein